MKKYNVQNYVRYKTDVKTSIANLEGKFYDEYNRNELIVKFMPLVENLAKKFPTGDQASGILSINDLIQIGNEALIRAVDRIEWDVLNNSNDIEKTLKSFISKRVKGAIRRRIDRHRGNIRIPEHKIEEMRNTGDKKMMEMFFNSIFLSLDKPKKSSDGDEDNYHEVEDVSTKYNIHILNAYLLGVMKKYLTNDEYEVLRLSYGLDTDNKMPAKKIAAKLGITGVRDYVTVSEIKRRAIHKLIDNVDYSQVIDFM
jgi:RNA polymerase sigma factor (sigma-70 family)